MLGDDRLVKLIPSSAMEKGEVLAQKRLSLDEVRVLLVLNKDPARPLTISEIADATAADTSSRKKGISIKMVRNALYGVPNDGIAHESTGYPGLIEREYVEPVD